MRIAILSFALLLTLITPNTISNETKTNTDLQLNKFYVKEQTTFPDRTKQVAEAKAWDNHKAEVARIEAEKARLASLVVQTPPQAQPTPQSVPAAPTGGCMDWIVAAGVTDVASAHWLIMKESGCNPNAVNRSSGACGIPQALPCSKLGTSDPVAQIRWMQNYVNGRYGGWSGAVAHSRARGWY